VTLIVGIKCEDGIVLGADGAATSGALGRMTIRQPVRKKLAIHQDRVVVGVSGPIGLGQRFNGEICQLWDNRAFSNKKPFQAMAEIAKVLRAHLQVEYSAAQSAQPIIGPQVAQQGVVSTTVVALPISKEACLFQFDQQGAPEQATADLPFVAVGGGQAIADPFLAFLRRVFWPDRLPSLAEGTLAIVWTLKHAIEVAPGGVANPTQLVELKQEGGDFVARELTEDQQGEHLEFVAEAERTLTRLGQPSKASPEPDDPKPPEA
jgi:20S proteasome alpha/beta subunit